MRKNLYLFILITFSIFYISCNSSRKSALPDRNLSTIALGSRNLAKIYNPLSTTIHPNVFVRRNGYKNIDLFVVVNDSELLFNKGNAQNQLQARVKIFYKILDNFENANTLDTSVKVITLRKSANSKTIAIKIHLKEVDVNNFVLQTTVTDLNRSKMSISFIEVDQTDNFGSQNFALSKTPSLQPAESDLFTLNDTIQIEYFAGNIVYKAFIDSVFPYPATPYSSVPAKEQFIKYSNVELSSHKLILHGKQPGIYYFTADTSQNIGLAVPCFASDYPFINMPQEMVKPLKYLTTTEEFDSISSSKTKKLAVDDFWLSCCDQNTKTAKQLIKIFYTRAVYSNVFFTDYKPGMLTDRGMVYIVLGPPEILAFNSKSEIWKYFDSRGRSYTFEFEKQKNKISSPEYVLKRGTELKPIWDEAIKTWRTGKVYSNSY